MDFAAVYHRSSEQMCYALNDEELIVNLITGKDVRRVHLAYDDPYCETLDPNFFGHRVEVPYKKDLGDRVWWTMTVRPKFRRIKYYFELECDGRHWGFCEDGFFELSEHGDFHPLRSPLSMFFSPWMNPADLFETPAWVPNTVWYEIFPDRFHRSPSAPPQDNVLPWRENAPVRNDERFGGSLRGITEKLPYLADLGINGLYLMPPWCSGSIHGYEVSDYEHVDPALGTDDDLADLVKAAHERGIKVMVDAPLNHSGNAFGPWRDVLEHGPDSAYYHWFMIERWPITPNRDLRETGDFYAFGHIGSMPKLNTNNPEVQAYLEQLCVGWVERFGFDGLRLDAAGEMSHACLGHLRRALKARFPELYLLGEIWQDASTWLYGDELDGVNNPALASVVGAFFADRTRTKHDVEHGVNKVFTRYREQANAALLNQLDSQDTERLARLSPSADECFQKLAMLLSMPGSPCLFYGTELLLEGGGDPDNRRCMPWSTLHAGARGWSAQTVRQLVELRRNEPLMRSPYFHFPNAWHEGRLVEYVKLDGNGGVLQVLLNAEEFDVWVGEAGEVLFAHGLEGGTLRRGGTLIRRC